MHEICLVLVENNCMEEMDFLVFKKEEASVEERTE